MYKNNFPLISDFCIVGCLHCITANSSKLSVAYLMLVLCLYKHARLLLFQQAILWILLVNFTRVQVTKHASGTALDPRSPRLLYIPTPNPSWTFIKYSLLATTHWLDNNTQYWDCGMHASVERLVAFSQQVQKLFVYYKTQDTGLASGFCFSLFGAKIPRFPESISATPFWIHAGCASEQERELEGECPCATHCSYVLAN